MDPILEICLHMAETSNCAKKQFGAVLVDTIRGIIVGKGANKRNLLLSKLGVCEGPCVRMEIQSRTESHIGACQHAEEIAIMDALKSAFSLNYFPSLEMYVACKKPDSLEACEERPPNFSCIRCANLMYILGISSVSVWSAEGWRRWAIPRALQQAYKYAIGEDSVDIS